MKSNKSSLRELRPKLGLCCGRGRSFLALHKMLVFVLQGIRQLAGLGCRDWWLHGEKADRKSNCALLQGVTSGVLAFTDYRLLITTIIKTVM